MAPMAINRFMLRRLECCSGVVLQRIPKTSEEVPVQTLPGTSPEGVHFMPEPQKSIAFHGIGACYKPDARHAGCQSR